MLRTFLIASSLAALVGTVQAQEKLKTDGYGSLSGKVTLSGTVPAIVDLTDKMKIHADKACCLDPKAKDIEKVDATWIVDPKTKAVQNVMVWVMPPKDTYFEIRFNLKKRKEVIEFDQPHCAFLPRVAAFNPVYYDGAKMVPTGQKLIIKNSASVSHNVRAIGHPLVNKGFNKTLAPGTQLDCLKDLDEDIRLKPQLLPVSVQCDIHTWMAAKLFVFDHPYYALTNAKGEFEIPYVPAGAEIRVYGYHEGVGYVTSGAKQGQPITIEKDKKHTLNLEVKAP